MAESMDSRRAWFATVYTPFIIFIVTYTHLRTAESKSFRMFDIEQYERAEYVGSSDT